MTLRSQPVLASQGRDSSTSIPAADMNTLILNNCEYVLGRQADVHVITKHDESLDLWTAEAIQFTDLERKVVAAGNANTFEEAMSQLHKSTAIASHRYEEDVSAKASHSSCSRQRGTESSDRHTFAPERRGVGQWSRPPTERNLGVKSCSSQEVVTLSSDDEDSHCRHPSTPTLRSLFPSVEQTMGRQPLYRRESAGNATGSDWEKDTARIVQVEKLVSPLQATRTVRLAPAEYYSAKALREMEKSFAETHLAGAAYCSLSRPLKNASLRESASSNTLHQPEARNPSFPFVTDDICVTALNVTWKGREGSKRTVLTCGMTASCIKRTACEFALSHSNEYKGTARLVTMLPEDKPVTKVSGHTSMCATITRATQGNRSFGVPHWAEELTESLSGNEMPEFDIEVKLVLQPPPPPPPL